MTGRVIDIRSISNKDAAAYYRLRRRISAFKLDNILAAEIGSGRGCPAAVGPNTKARFHASAFDFLAGREEHERNDRL